MPPTGPSVLIIEARFYQEISDELARGALGALARAGVASERLVVPGALEIPVALELAARSGRVGGDGRHQGCVALGCVIRGETSHYDIVARESARGLMDVALRHGIPVGNGILTVDTAEQARMRAAVGKGDKGAAAAAACLALMALDAGARAGRP